MVLARTILPVPFGYMLTLPLPTVSNVRESTLPMMFEVYSIVPTFTFDPSTLPLADK